MKSILYSIALFIVLNVSSGIALAHSDEALKELVVDYYAPVRDALASDNFEAAKQASVKFSEFAKTNEKPAAADIEALTKAGSIEGLRKAFKSVSNYVIGHSRDRPANGGFRAGYFVLYCPVAKAYWMQTVKEAGNPYLGKAKLNCGAEMAGPAPGWKPQPWPWDPDKWNLKEAAKK